MNKMQEMFQMKIKLKDDIPVQQSFYAILKQFHSEMKQCIKDLLNKLWIINSYLEYASAVVAVRKI